MVSLWPPCFSGRSVFVAVVNLTSAQPAWSEPKGGGKEGGGHSGTKWLPTAKQPHTAEAMNAEMYGRLTHLKAKKKKRGGGRGSTLTSKPNKGSNL